MVDISYLPSKYKLKEEQLDAIEFCYSRDTAIMSLGTGVGKTITSCIIVKQLLKDIENSVAVFVIPSRAIKAFKKELKACDLDFNLWESSGRTHVKGARILLITHTSLVKYQNDLKALSKYYCIGVVDEVHNFSANYDEQQVKLNKGTEALIKIRPIFKKFYALTATTTKNDYMSLYTMSNIVRPKYFGSPDQFKNNFCVIEKSFFKVKVSWKPSPITKTKSKVVRFKNRNELQRKLDDLIIFRQLSYNVDFNEIDVPLDMWDDYRSIGTGSKIVKKTKSTLSDFSIRLGSLQKLMDNIPLYDKQDNLLFPIKDITNKEQALLDLVDNLVDNGHIPLIYCFYLDTIDRVEMLVKTRLKHVLKDVFIISGKIPQKERALVEDKITNNTVTILNRAGTESINLQKADTIIFYNIPWSIQEYLQCLGRITRNDTEFSKQYVYFLEYEGTIDNYKMIRIKDRLGIVEQVQGDQLDSSDGISLDGEDMNIVKNLLLWTYKNKEPVSKSEILNYLKRDD